MNLQGLFNLIDGKKTYLVTLAAVVYGVGIDYHWWPHSMTLDSVLGGGIIMALRSAVAKIVAPGFQGQSFVPLGVPQAGIQQQGGSRGNTK